MVTSTQVLRNSESLVSDVYFYLKDLLPFSEYLNVEMVIRKFCDKIFRTESEAQRAPPISDHPKHHAQIPSHKKAKDNSVIVTGDPSNKSPNTGKKKLQDAKTNTDLVETRDVATDTDPSDTQNTLAEISKRDETINSLKQEISKRDETTSSLIQDISKRDETVNSLKQFLEQERQARIRVEDETRQLSSRLKSIQTKWKRTASELDQVQRQSRNCKPVTDEELKGMVRQLRYNIRSFAIQHFSDRAGYGQTETKLEFASYMPASEGHYLDRPENFPPLVQVFVWKILMGQVFDCFRWAGSVSESFDEIWGHLVSGISKENTLTFTAVQKLHQWRATTAILVSESLDEEDLSYLQDGKGYIMGETLKVLKLFSNEPYEDELSNILDDAIKLDKMICSQVAKISWEFGEPPKRVNDQDSTSLDIVDKVVIFPAMLKRGKSNGEDFNVQSVLLPGVEGFCTRGKKQEL
ncbi:hypothetical protein F4806DRAFT_482253 [Annulohypoxylon nitens]|nr:hypothetical protein F4806DRAFT_482253 [Annulohypoxylon nitens]